MNTLPPDPSRGRPDGDDEPGADAPDIAIDPTELQRLQGLLRDVPAPDAERRRSHLAAAMAAFDAADDESSPAAAPVAPVVPIRRRSGRSLQLLAAAAAVVLVVGVGVSIVSSNDSSDDSAELATAGAPEVSGDAGSADAGSAAEESAARDALDAGADTDATGPAPQATKESAGNDAYDAPTVAGAEAAPATTAPLAPGPIPDLGSFTDDAALLQAIIATRTAGVATSPPSGPTDDSAPTTLAPTASRSFASVCADTITAGAQVRYTAIVAGSPVFVVERPDGAAVVVDSTTCDERPL